jgi:mono/diheme cytochrome c family protein
MQPHTGRWRLGIPAALAAPIFSMALSLAVAACGGVGERTPTPGDVEAGQAEYRGSCAACHGLNAEGRHLLGQSLHENAFVRGLSDAQLVDFILRGRPATDPENLSGVEMPPRGGNPSLTDAQIELIVAYLRSLQ